MGWNTAGMRLAERPAVTLWDHNGHYHRYVLSVLPPAPDRVLDVGCGNGSFALRLAARARRVDAIDISTEMIAAARARSRHLDNVRWMAGDVLRWPLTVGGYDAVTAIASMHHLPLERGLDRLADLVRPGGMLAVLGLARPGSVTDYAWAAAAVPADVAVGAVKALAGRSGHADQGLGPAGSATLMPVRDPVTTLGEIAAAARRPLPGARIRRHLFYRYSLVWRRPEA